MLIQGVVLSAAVLGAQQLGMRQDPANAQGMGATYAFATLTLAELFWAHACRNIRKPAWSIGFFKNKMAWLASAVGALLLVLVMTIPPLEIIFQLHEVHSADWLWIIVMSLGVTLIMEPVKTIVASMMGAPKAAEAQPQHHD
jgi:Ca2+-transporting ATPase